MDGRKRVATHGGDLKTNFVIGHFAGAQLAAPVCTDKRYLYVEKVSRSIIKAFVPDVGDNYEVPMQIATCEQGRKDSYKRMFADAASQNDLSPFTHIVYVLPPIAVLLSSC